MPQLINPIGISAHRHIGTFLTGIFLLTLTSCGDGMLHEYLNGDSLIWTNVPVYVDSTGHAEITVQVEGGNPELTVYYGCAGADSSKLHNINADLLVDGKVLVPEYDSTTSGIPQYEENLSVQVSKKYTSISELPKQLSVHFTSESAGGNTDTTIVLTLRSQKDTRAPIHIH